MYRKALGRCFLLIAVIGLGFAQAPQSQNQRLVSKVDAKRADKLFQRAIRLQAQDRLEESSAALDASLELDPTDAVHATAREYVRQQRVTRHIDRGNTLSDRKLLIEAAAEFRAALELDPANTFAAQRYQDVSGAPYVEEARVLSPLTYVSEPDLQPRAEKHEFDFRGNSRQLIEQVARAYGIEAAFDDSVPARQVRFKLDATDFDTAMQAVRKVTHVFFVTLSATQVLAVNDTPETRRRFERMSLRTFYIPEAATPQELQDITNTLRAMLDIRFVNANAATSTLTVRAPRQLLDAAEKIIAGLSSARPEILLDVYAYQVSQTKSKQVGVDLPLQFTAFNVGTEVRALVNRPGIQDLINQLVGGGQLSNADIAALAGLLAAAQQGSNSPLLQPFATFGGGKTLSGLTIPSATVKLNFNESSAKLLQHATLRAQQGRVANFHIGERFPVLTSSYSTVLNFPTLPNRPTPLNNNLQPLTPAFTYEDLGITLKTTPYVNAVLDVTLQFELGIRSLSGASFNTVPAISNREYTGTIGIKAGQSSVIAGSISESEQRSMRGMPWLSSIPGFKYAVSSTSTEVNTSQLLIVIVPKIVRAPRTLETSSETYLDGS